MTFDYPHPTPHEKRVGLHYKAFWPSWSMPPFTNQPLAKTKIFMPCRIREVGLGGKEYGGCPYFGVKDLPEYRSD